jgi:NAD(P)-dependent dehydrogenase (short-subunit alcohol dehydrogenase family)
MRPSRSGWTVGGGSGQLGREQRGESVGTVETSASLEGKRAVVVGAGFGIGRAVARQLSAHGARLAVVDIDQERVGAIADELSAARISADVTIRSEANTVIDRAADELGPLDILVNIVGRGRSRPVADLDSDSELEILRVNYLQHVDMCTGFARRCVEDGRPGAITLVSSLAGLIPFPERAGYGAAKAALQSFARSMAVELGPFGVRVNCVAPGIVRTDRSNYPPDVVQAFVAAVPLRRLVSQDDVANAVTFLSSGLASFITGQTLVVDGGASLYTKMWPSPRTS